MPLVLEAPACHHPAVGVQPPHRGQVEDFVQANDNM